MWPQGPIGAPPPGSSGHLTPGAPFPGPMAPHPGMYPSGQMSLPYGQMEGNHAMYDQRMMAARAAGRPGMMAPEYPTMPGIAQNPGAQQMMMNRMAYPPGHPQMAGPPMQYGQMMRAPPVSVYGQMNQPQPYPVTAHPNPTPAPISPELRQIYETCHAYTTLRPVVEESEVPVGSMGIEAMILPDALHQLESSNDSDFLLTVWPISKGHDHIQFSIYFNQQLVVTNASENKCVSIKSLVKSGINMFHFVYNSHEKYHRFCCEFVTKKPLIDLRKISMSKKPGDFNSLVQQSKVGYIQMAQRRQAGFVNTSILCSLTKKRMFTPARHTDCKKALFEFGNMINMNKDKNRYYCAQCGNTFKFEDIIIDFFMMQVISHMPSNVTDVIIDKAGGFRPAEAEKDEQKPKRGKKKNDDGNANSIKRIKSETFVKQEPGMFGDMHNRGIPYSPMPMPGSVPPDWSRLQSPSFSMHSPNKIQLGPATPATPGLVYQNPASAGSMLNMSSPRQTMLPAPAQHHAVIGAPQEQVSTAVASGSAPYTPESVMSDHDMGFGHINDDLALIGKPLFVDREDVLSHLLIDTNSSTLREFDTSDYDDELSHIREPLKRLLAPSSSSSTSTTFTPPFDDIHLGSRPSH
uniref:SP-RING-type domain-containing protein n=1 Tax=Caenorhabditis japonica TaxID=281687 RepID=A0A8R1HJQ7_CAEJA